MKGILSINKINTKLVVTFSIVAILSIGYTWTFIDLFEIGLSGNSSITGLVNPDTFIYKFVYENMKYMGIFNPNIKNSIGPALLWQLVNGNWYIASIFNLLMLLLSVVFLNKIGNHIGISINNKVVFFLVLLPETFIYSIGIMKEIPMLLLFSALSFYFLKKRWLPFLICFILLAFFRFQFSLIIFLFLLVQLFFRKKNIRFLFFIFLMVASLYPLLDQHRTAFTLEIGTDLRMEGGGILYTEKGALTGTAALLHTIQNKWYGVSALAIAVKMLMLISPWPIPSFPPGSYLDIMIVAWTISLIIFLPVWFKYFRCLIYSLRYPDSLKQDERVLLSISFICIMLLGLSGFAQHRYLYPDLGLVLLVAYIPIGSRQRRDRTSE